MKRPLRAVAQGPEQARCGDCDEPWDDEHHALGHPEHHPFRQGGPRVAAPEPDVVARNAVWAALGRASERYPNGHLSRAEVADVVAAVPRAVAASETATEMALRLCRDEMLLLIRERDEARAAAQGPEQAPEPCDLRSRWSGNTGPMWCHTHDVPVEGHWPATPPVDWREMFLQVGQKWTALLEHYDLAEDAQPDDIIRAVAQGPEQARDSGLREAAERVVTEAETDDNWEGEYTDYLVPGDAFEALRAALGAAHEERGLDPEALEWRKACGVILKRRGILTTGIPERVWAEIVAEHARLATPAPSTEGEE